MAPKNEQLSAAEKAEIMGEGFSLAHQQEAQERYGKTDDWAEYQRRTASMDRADWQNGKQQVEEVEHALVEAFNRGVQPGSEEANALAERHRASLFFFEVTPAKHAILARGYVEDARFKAHYEKLAPGLAEWLREVIFENARAHGIDPEKAAWG
ncbi:TipAS antibiotic-recognition domain-containing protein [Rothia mucilaginosa]|uniref:TipAS antibiotic-recognition domain-containing protein n=1 Tax=Rothia mucilaginosa TaxID=43675 RepID=UPI0039A0074A